MVLCTNCIKEGFEACMHAVPPMEGLEMVPRAQPHMQPEVKGMLMSEDDRRERREQQREWYRRRRSQMTDQEIACQNERRRMRYRLRRLQANAEQAEGSTSRNPVPGLHEGSALVTVREVMEKAVVVEKVQQQSIREWQAWMNGHRIERQEQQGLNYGQQWGQVSGEGVKEHGGQQKQWRWKVEARKGSACAEAKPSHLNLMVGDATGAVEGYDSETTETDDSLQGMVPGSHGGAHVVGNQLPEVDYLGRTYEVTSKALSFEGTSRIHQPVAWRASFLPNSIRLTEVKRLARAMHSLSAS